VGGTLHIIVNNQVGFTTDPIDARSTRYASDVAKGFEVPIIHVNADDAEACVIAMRIAVAYRTRVREGLPHRPRRLPPLGHNEGDEPTYTQPQLYEKMKAHPTPRQVWGAPGRRGRGAAAEVDALDKEVDAEIQARSSIRRPPGTASGASVPGARANALARVETAVQAETTAARSTRRCSTIRGLHAAPAAGEAARAPRRDALGGDGGIDWGHAETLAFASLLSDGVSVPLTGQDVERGTFSHRHAVLNDAENGRSTRRWPPAGGDGPRSRSTTRALSEMAVMGFEYGYSVAAPDTLTLWEAQFGDFVNVAQPIIDQFLAADRAKWGRTPASCCCCRTATRGRGRSTRARASSASCSCARRQHARRLSELAGAVLPHAAAQASCANAASAGADAAQVAAAPRAGGVERWTSSRGRLPAGDRRSARRSKRARCAAGVLHRQDLLRHGLARRSPSRGGGARRGAVSVAARAVARNRRPYPNIDEVAWAQEEPKNMGAWTSWRRVCASPPATRS
jgi:2-oxoglutarate dehydrogenase E1 component